MANVRIPQLTPSVGVTGAELVEIAIAVPPGSSTYESRYMTTAMIASLAAGGVIAGTTQIITTSDPVVVLDTDALIILNKAIASVTPIALPAVASRNGLPLKITDWMGNGGDVTITPDGSETIMGLAQAILGSYGQGIGSAAAVTLYPSTDLSGWYYAP